MFKIIEDCSPYYIRFTHDGINELIKHCLTLIPSVDNLDKDFTHHKLSLDQGRNLLNLTPISKVMPIWEERVSFFISKPGLYYRAHKDGLDTRFSINYTVKILDDKCVTSWYCDDDLKDYQIDPLSVESRRNPLTAVSSRECVGFVKSNHIPTKTMIAKQGEVILFNTDLFHDWDNTTSVNERVVLTLRIAKPLKSKTYFEDAKRILFGTSL